MRLHLPRAGRDGRLARLHLRRNLRIIRLQSNGSGQGGKSALRANNHGRPGRMCYHYSGCAHATIRVAGRSRAGDARKGEASSPRRATRNQAVRRPHTPQRGGGMPSTACLRGTTCHCAETDQCVWSRPLCRQESDMKRARLLTAMDGRNSILIPSYPDRDP